MLENYDAYCKRCDEIFGWVMRGREEGYDLGQKNGYDLGQKKSREEIVMNMVDNNMTLDVISKATKLTIDEIKKNYNLNNAY